MNNKSVLAKLAAVAVFAVLTTAFSGCFTSNRVTLATLNTPEAVLAGEIMALQLENFGMEVVRGRTYHSLAELEAGMRAGEFDISAVFLQDALTGFAVIGESPVFDQTLAEEIVNNTIRDVFGYMLLDWWNIHAHYSLVMSERFTQDDQFNLVMLSVIAPDLTLAATQDFLESAGGLAHLRELFGELEFGRVIVVDQEDLYDAAGLGADILVVRSFQEGDWFADAGYFPIGEGFSLWPSNPMVPVASEYVMERLPEIRAILSSISFHIEPATFARNLRAIGQGTQTFEQAANDILQSR